MEKYIQNDDLIKLGEEVRQLARNVLQEMNARALKLFDLPAHKRIFLFIFTRAMKTFAAIETLCQHGYGQDVAPLLRSIMENLITARYIVHDLNQADQLARRFVEYKWIIFRRTLAEEELSLRAAPEAARQGFEQKKRLVLEHVQKYKVDYNIQSDRALLTWSGRTVKDMARAVGHQLHQEYEQTFRFCSRFSHPTILGDREYMVQDDKTLTFSPQPSRVGTEMNYVTAAIYCLRFLEAANALFALSFGPQAQDLLRRCQHLAGGEGETPAAGQSSLKPPANIRDVKVFFQL